METKEFLQSKKFKKISYGLAGAIILLLVFKAGMAVGYHKAAFSYRMGENYYRNFGPRRNFLSGLAHDDFSAAHGEIGKIVSIDAASIVIADRDEPEKIVLISDQTQVRKMRDMLKPSDLKVDDYVMVLGSPDEQGRIQAKLIRIIPPPPESDEEILEGR